MVNDYVCGLDVVPFRFWLDVFIGNLLFLERFILNKRTRCYVYIVIDWYGKQERYPY